MDALQRSEWHVHAKGCKKKAQEKKTDDWVSFESDMSLEAPSPQKESPRLDNALLSNFVEQNGYRPLPLHLPSGKKSASFESHTGKKGSDSMMPPISESSPMQSFKNFRENSPSFQNFQDLSPSVKGSIRFRTDSQMSSDFCSRPLGRHRTRSRIMTGDTGEIYWSGTSRSQSLAESESHPSLKSRKSSLLESQSQEAEGLMAEFSEAVRQRCRAGTRHRRSTALIKKEMIDAATCNSEEGTLQVDVLKEHGFLNEDLCRVIYDERKEEFPPELLCHLVLNTSGGLDNDTESGQPKIRRLWTEEKYWWFFYLLISVVFNIASLLVMNWGIFQTYMKGLEKSLEYMHQEMVQPSLSTLANVTNSLSYTADQGSVESVRRQNMLNKLVLEHIHDVSSQHIFMNLAALVAIWEILWIFVKVLYSLQLWWIFKMDASEYRSYRAIRIFFTTELPQFSTFSALKLMTRVHPTLLYNGFYDNLNESHWRATRLGLTLSSIAFLVKSLGCAAAALCAFAIKILAVGFALLDTRMLWLLRVGSLLALMVQCMGCIMLEQVLQDRVLLFVFGGQDAMYRDDELAFKSVYECRLVKQIWEEFWQKGKYFKAIVLLATFDHYDLQNLLIEADDLEIALRMAGTPMCSSASPSFFMDSPLSRREDLEKFREGATQRIDATSDEKKPYDPEEPIGMIERLAEGKPMSRLAFAESILLPGIVSKSPRPQGQQGQGLMTIHEQRTPSASPSREGLAEVAWKRRQAREDSSNEGENWELREDSQPRPISALHAELWDPPSAAELWDSSEAGPQEPELEPLVPSEARKVQKPGGNFRHLREDSIASFDSREGTDESCGMPVITRALQKLSCGMPSNHRADAALQWSGDVV